LAVEENMYISAINKCNPDNKTPYFGRLIKDMSSLNVINGMSKSDIVELGKIEKRLSKSKFWDLKISSLDKEHKDLNFTFIRKGENHGIIANGIHPYKKNADTISIYTLNESSNFDTISSIEDLKFKTIEIADRIYDSYLKSVQFLFKKNWKLSPIESIKNKEIQLHMLEQAYEHMGGSKNQQYLSSFASTKKTVGR
jgi:hypothetical protein